MYSTVSAVDFARLFLSSLFSPNLLAMLHLHMMYNISSGNSADESKQTLTFLYTIRIRVTCGLISRFSTEMSHPRSVELEKFTLIFFGVFAYRAHAEFWLNEFPLNFLFSDEMRKIKTKEI